MAGTSIKKKRKKKKGNQGRGGIFVRNSTVEITQGFEDQLKLGGGRHT